MKPLAFDSSARHQSGFTLVELLVSLALGLAVLVGLSSVYVAAKQSFRFQETSGRLQEDAVFALDMISRDLRMAGFAGCRGVDPNRHAGSAPCRRRGVPHGPAPLPPVRLRPAGADPL